MNIIHVKKLAESSLTRVSRFVEELASRAPPGVHLPLVVLHHTLVEDGASEGVSPQPLSLAQPVGGRLHREGGQGGDVWGEHVGDVLLLLFFQLILVHAVVDIIDGVS